MRPFLLLDVYDAGKRGERNVPYKYAQLCVRLCLMKWGLEGTKFINETSEGPDVRFRVVRFFLHQFWGHVVGCLVPRG